MVKRGLEGHGVTWKGEKGLEKGCNGVNREVKGWKEEEGSVLEVWRSVGG